MGRGALRLFGIAGTIFAYVVGILLLSIISLQNTQNRRPRIRSLTERREFSMMTVHPTLTWCKELRFLDHAAALGRNFTSPTKLMQTFPGHYVKRKWRNANPIKTTTTTTTTVAPQKSYQKPQEDDYNDIETQLNYEPLLWPKGKKWPKRGDRRKQLDGNTEMKDKKENKLTALVSFPGSGNTWLRYLLQQSTGILTGSIYKDYGLLRSGFPAENVANSSVLAIKTHEWGSPAFTMFRKAILLVRDPEKAITAEFNRQSAGHVGFASAERYTRIEGRYWQQFVVNKLWLWEQTNLSWAKDFPGELKIIFYDDLVKNVEENLRDVLRFMNYPIDEQLIGCTILRKEGIYRRRKRILSFDPFTQAMHARINAKRDEVYRKLGRI